MVNLDRETIDEAIWFIEEELEELLFDPAPDREYEKELQDTLEHLENNKRSGEIKPHHANRIKNWIGLKYNNEEHHEDSYLDKIEQLEKTLNEKLKE